LPPLNVAVVAACPFPAPRGTPLRIQRLAEAVAARGHRVHVVTYHYGSGEVAPELTIHRASGVGSYNKLAPGPTYMKLALLDPLLTVKLRQVLRQFPIDVIHAHHFEGLIAGQLARVGTGIPLVFDAHTLLMSELPFYRLGLPSGLKRFIAATFDRHLPVMGDHVVTVTERIRERLIELRAVSPHRSTIVRNGADLHLFLAANGNHATKRNAPTLIFTGNLAPYQGIDLMLRAFRAVLDRRKDARLKIVTESPFDRYDALAQGLGIRESIDVVQSPFDGVPAHIAAATVALNPRTDCDGIPIKLLNYMAAGKPVVSFAGSAPGVRHRENGWVVPDGDIMGFAEGALTLMGNVDLANSLGSAGRRFVEAQHSWAHSAELLEEIFQSLVAERGSLAS
jgi:glycosyltransferase involved in cell wall biosynthesis